MNDLDYLRLSKPQKLLHKLGELLKSLPGRIAGFFVGIGMFLWNIIKGIGLAVADVVNTFIHGDWKTKISYVIMGFGSIMRGQWLRGILFFVFEAVFICYLSFFGWEYVMKLGTLGTVDSGYTDDGLYRYGDDSFLIMLYGVLTLFFIVAFIYTWYVNIKQNKISEQIIKSGKPLKSAKDDMHALLDNQFHKTLLALPTMGVAIFTILPIIFMILVAFTNYDHDHQPPTDRFQWVGTENFETLLTTEEQPIEISNITENPANGMVSVTVTAKNGDTFVMDVSPEDRAKLDEAQAVIAMPAPEYPLELSSADGAALVPYDNTKRAASYLRLNLADGSRLTLTCKKSNAGYNAISAMLKEVESSKAAYTIALSAANEEGQQVLSVTGPDGTLTEMTVTKIEAQLAADIRADFALEYFDEQPLALTSYEKDGGIIGISVDNTDGKTIVANLPASEAENVEKAKALIAAGGSMALDKTMEDILGEIQTTDAEGNVTTETAIVGQKYTFTMTFTGPDQEGAEPEVVTIVATENARETYNGVITFVGAEDQRVELTASEIRFTELPSMPKTFAQVLLWTLIWAFFATFLNYFLGMLVAIMINKKGIKLKKLWRTVLVMTIAIPQFISLLYVSKMFAADGLINATLMNWGWISEPLPFWTNANWAKVTIIGINVWIGIPYLMLIATGILMNIPADLYESARIDGANAFQTYMKITLPYMLFVTGPYLLTSFTGNINNFNVIFLLSQGKPLSMDMMGNAGNTDLLLAWLYKMPVTDSNSKLAAVMGILVFVVCAVINLVVYNMIPSVKNEEDFQ